MHELPIVKSLFDICMKHATSNGVKKVIAVNLKVGEVSDLQDEWIQRYFDFLAKGTVVEGARLVIERVPLVVRCQKCAESFPVDIRQGGKVECPKCQATEFAYVSGREYTVDSMEVA
jgi:hydrogenase nickel incorporation protein HypA/HybF